MSREFYIRKYQIYLIDDETQNFNYHLGGNPSCANGYHGIGDRDMDLQDKEIYCQQTLYISHIYEEKSVMRG
jgi:hypothetical protein